MSTVVRMARRRSDLAVAEFQQLAEGSSDWGWAASLGLRQARQAVTLPGGYRRGEPIFDIVDEFDFDDEATAAAFLTNPTLTAGPGFELLDGSSVRSLIVEQYIAKPGAIPFPAVKNYEVVTRRADLDWTEFGRYWREVHGPLGAAIPAIHRYVQAHLARAYRDSGQAWCDGLAMTWFDDVAGMRAGAATDHYQVLRADEGNFLTGELPFLITTERTTYPRQFAND